jgi:tetratricopeptide (TPR) repeat protein
MQFITSESLFSRLGVALASGVVLLAVVLGCSDDFLTRTPPSSLSTATFYQTEEDAVSAINAVYATMQKNPLYGRNYDKVTIVPSDDAKIHNTVGASFENHSFNPAAPQIMDVFSGLYEGVFRANLVLQEVPEIDMSEDKKRRILGEARFLRAFYYWHLGANYGDVPLIEEAYPNNPEKAQKPKDDVGQIYDFAISDLQQAVDALPSSYGSSNVGRATSGAARALLGKVHLYDENYEEAESTLRDVIDSDEYELMPSHKEMFETDNNKEYIFEIQYKDTGGSVWGSQDSPNLNEGHLRARLNLPEGGGGFGNIPPTQDIVDAFEEGDPRLDYAVWMEGDDYGEPGQFNESGKYNPEWSPTGFSLRKGLTPLQPFDADISTNYPLIRLADVLLMYAEAANENSNQGAAISAINRVRARSDMPTYPDDEAPYSVSSSSSQEEVFEAIVHERRVELAFENHRYLDLKRWGLAEEKLGRLGFQPKHRFLPLPQQEVDTNQELEQNPDW